MVIVLLALLGCPTPEVSEEAPLMAAKDLLVRASLDLRGTRPTTEEYEQVEQNPDAVDDLMDAYMDSPAFEGRVAQLFAEVLLTRTESYTVDATAYGEDIDQADFIRSVGDEAIRMIGHVAANDRPWTDLVQGNWTMANETLGAIWPVEYPEGETGWRPSAYTDNRPGAGLLSTNSMWWRYNSTASNANRKRANQISRIFLCHDYLLREIDFDRNVNLLDEASVNDALVSNPACVNCHASLDPLAGYLYGFWYVRTNNVVDITYYHPEREQNWKRVTGIAPGYYGTPGYTLGDLGAQIAADNRFVSCAVEHSWELLLRREVSLEDTQTLSLHREAFLDGGLTVRPLFRSILQTPEYRAGLTDAVGTVSKKMVTPGLLASQIADITGFEWRRLGYDVMASDNFGYLSLAGGADGYFVTQHARQPNATLILVQERLAEAAALHVVAQDLTAESGRTLFHHVDFTETPDTNRAAMVEQIQFLHFRIFGDRIAPDGEEIDANLELWRAIYAIENKPDRAWAGLLSALLREPDILFY